MENFRDKGLPNNPMLALHVTTCGGTGLPRFEWIAKLGFIIGSSSALSLPRVAPPWSGGGEAF